MDNYSVTGGDASIRSALFPWFNRYIVASCWRKMHLRISHWSSTAVLNHLSALGSDQISSWFYNREAAEKYHDKDLKNFLASRKNDIRRLLQDHPLFSTNGDALLHSVESTEPSIYNKATCVEFHYLFVGTLFGYAHKLGHLKKIIGNAEKKDKVILRATEILFFLRLLWLITESAAYQRHMDVIGPHLTPITYKSISHYRELAEGTGLDFRDAPGMYPVVSEGSRPEGLGLEDPGLEGSGLEGPESEDEYDLDGAKDPSLLFRAVISKLVAYMNAAKMIGVFCTQLATAGGDSSSFTVSLICTSPAKKAQLSWWGIQDVLNRFDLPDDTRDIIRDIAYAPNQDHTCSPYSKRP
jgi:hypothetical protein